MLHSSKKLESHEEFSRHLNIEFLTVDNNKRIPAIITDNESSFRVYQTVCFFELFYLLMFAI